MLKDWPDLAPARALAASDCLMRPQDYASKLAYCGRCDRLSFAPCRSCIQPSVMGGDRIFDLR